MSRELSCIVHRFASALASRLNAIIPSTMQVWPAGAAGADLPLPGAPAVGGAVLVWYGSEHTPVVRLDPIVFSELIE